MRSSCVRCVGSSVGVGAEGVAPDVDGAVDAEDGDEEGVMAERVDAEERRA